MSYTGKYAFEPHILIGFRALFCGFSKRPGRALTFLPDGRRVWYFFCQEEKYQPKAEMDCTQRRRDAEMFGLCL
jgi:hypothetical protein